MFATLHKCAACINNTNENVGGLLINLELCELHCVVHVRNLDGPDTRWVR
jgi:hypothetical protein